MKKSILLTGIIFALCFSFTSCYSVFSGGTGGQIVDSESTSNPKAGIANVDIYAYVKAKDRDKDFNAWTEGTVFSPSADYYGHTTSGVDGTFTISKLVWKSGNPDFGKDADYTEIFLLFYHENYGLTKGSTVIVSDSTTDTVYAELTKVRKETEVKLDFQDVASGLNTSETVYVEISVPQNTQSITGATPKIYKTNITGTGSVTVSYPRWQSDENKNNGTETEPEIQITYYQNADIVTWKGCYNGDSENDDFAFRDDANGKTVIKKSIMGSEYRITLYGKKTKFNVPNFSGQWGDKNGVTLNLIRSTDNGTTYTVDCGSVETAPRYVGSDGTPVNGNFNNLGLGNYWFDYSYTDKTSTGYFKITDGASSIVKEVSTERNTVTIQK